MPSAICSNLLPHYTTWKSSLDEMHRAMVAYQESGSEADRDAFRRAEGRAKAAMERFLERRMFRLPSFQDRDAIRSFEVCCVDAYVLQHIEKLLHAESLPLAVVINGGHVTKLVPIFERNIDLSQMNSVLRYIAVLGKIKILHLPSGSNIAIHRLPPALEELEINGCRVASLPDTYPKTFNSLSCKKAHFSCQLTGLPDWLLSLNLEGSNIEELPDPLPSQLQMMNLKKSSVKVIPRLPELFEDLYCGGTAIVALPSLPRNLTYLSCENSQITDLPELPDSLHFIDIKNTPAARNTDVQRRLQEFQEKHPSATVSF